VRGMQQRMMPRPHAAMPTTKVAGCHCLPSSHPLQESHPFQQRWQLTSTLGGFPRWTARAAAIGHLWAGRSHFYCPHPAKLTAGTSAARDQAKVRLLSAAVTELANA
jgi:hypothetical protein